jgi:hypothetical protein
MGEEGGEDPIYGSPQGGGHLIPRVSPGGGYLFWGESAMVDGREGRRNTEKKDFTTKVTKKHEGKKRNKNVKRKT